MSKDAFRDREKGFEAKYEHDQELQFRVQSLRDKMFGLWLAGEFGLNGEDAVNYAKEVVASNFDRPGDDDMLDKVEADLKERNVSIGRDILVQRLDAFAADAHNELAGEYRP